MATGPVHQAGFYMEAFSKVKTLSGAPRILISGTADYSMLAHALVAFRSRGLEPAITVIDICETPLALNRWYATRASCSVETHRCDVLKFTHEQKFDAVCTDNFFAQIPSAARTALVAQWYQLLRSGGMVITVNRLRPDSDGKQVSFTVDQVSAFVARVRDMAVSMRDQLQIDSEALVRAAEMYAHNMRTWPVRSQDEIVGLFERGGFSVDSSLASNVLGTQPNIPTGPTVPGNSLYLQLIATRL